LEDTKWIVQELDQMFKRGSAALPGKIQTH
jgi:hypothetical protein